MGDWLEGVSSRYGVDPCLFAGLFVVVHGGVFYLCLFLAALQVRLRAWRRAGAWAGGAVLAYLTPWLYLLAVGRLPGWARAVVVLVALASLALVGRRLARRFRSSGGPPS